MSVQIMGRSKVDFDAECPRVGTAVVGMDILQVDVIAVTELHGEGKISVRFHGAEQVRL